MSHISFAQEGQEILSMDDFLKVVRSFHPIAKQADLNIEIGDANRIEAGGAFDPILAMASDRKSFDGKNYFVKNSADIFLPAWYGMSFYGGVADNSGGLINEEETNGMFTYAGLNVSVLQNLVLDKRRASLQQAKLMQQQNQFEKINTINDLLLQAHLAYYNWLRDYLILQVVEEAVRVNFDRFNFVKSSYLQGDRSGLDTIEAKTQLLSFQQKREEVFLALVASKLNLETFIWNQEEQPLYLDNFVIPDTTTIDGFAIEQLLIDMDNWANVRAAEHPKISINEFKIRGLEVARKLKFQKFLPKLNVKYDFLRKGNQFPIDNSNFFAFEDNYKFGLSFSMPIFNRSAFGQYQAAKSKIKMVTLDNFYTKLTIENKIRYQMEEVSNVSNQVDLFTEAVDLYRQLYDAESFRFSIGESSLFLLNTRANKYLETQQKLIELKTKLNQANSKLQWAAGMLR